MSISRFPQLEPMGDDALIIRLGDAIDRSTFVAIQELMDRLERSVSPGIVELVPAFTSVTIFYDPASCTWPEFRSRIEKLIVGEPPPSPRLQRKLEIPVCYGGEFGPDLEFVAGHNRLEPAEVIAIHSAADYLVHMIGFSPGFPYLGGLSPRIATPRRPYPRARVPAGSVGIAGNQTGIYSLPTPGGWQLIGRTPLSLFLPAIDPPSRLRAGDIVRFRAISRAEYDRFPEESG